MLRALVVASGNAAVPLEAIDGPLYMVALAVLLGVIGPRPLQTPLGGEHRTDSTPPQFLPHFVAAIPSVRNQLHRSLLRATRTQTFHSASIQKRKKARHFTPLAACQVDGQGPSISFALQMKLRAKSTAGTAQSFFLLTTSGAGRMLMGAYHGGIDRLGLPVECAALIRKFLQFAEHPDPDSTCAPPVKTCRYGTPVAIAGRKVTPGAAGTEEPQNGIEERSIIQPRATAKSLRCGQQGLKLLPLMVCQVMSVESRQASEANGKP